ncbi:MBL fold metallo-hydrolase RNA specificity domain-containing protein [Legionella oakridgensis]|uniref:Metallo-beta-lactamase n=2 Tax=Legionella oakridgensis TaxID=29423 RepID=A0A0W0X1A8_9GAMM|nr:MBL fold metallo-hydrolase RNA specificity domain-containing protein [Legionella oakridgensis]AHE66980.1 putative metal-dependent rnase [Legionella oakridgensis ATCC 33761 = DSM 21215]ETO93341.1 putative metal-dependent Rnase [Legionella oakridgensis RV-2-2007]KTD38364.1 metallo-beta-lactamase [Legionella oakridgensis]STY20082.1 metallo-beta-lactamase [Legionella longbeachae]
MCGFQAAGTRGDRLLRGEDKIKMFGQMVPIRAEIVRLQNTSAHADYEEILAWLGGVKQVPKKLFITYGENDASAALKEKIEKRYGWHCYVPSYLDDELLD